MRINPLSSYASLMRTQVPAFPKASLQRSGDSGGKIEEALIRTVPNSGKVFTLLGISLSEALEILKAYKAGSPFGSLAEVRQKIGQVIHS